MYMYQSYRHQCKNCLPGFRMLSPSNYALYIICCAASAYKQAKKMYVLIKNVQNCPTLYKFNNCLAEDQDPLFINASQWTVVFKCIISEGPCTGYTLVIHVPYLTPPSQSFFFFISGEIFVPLQLFVTCRAGELRNWCLYQCTYNLWWVHKYRFFELRGTLSNKMTTMGFEPILFRPEVHVDVLAFFGKKLHLNSHIVHWSWTRYKLSP